MAASLPWKAEFASIHRLRLDRFLYPLPRDLCAISCLGCTVYPASLAGFLWLVHLYGFTFPVLFLQHNRRHPPPLPPPPPPSTPPTPPPPPPLPPPPPAPPPPP